MYRGEKKFLCTLLSVAIVLVSIGWVMKVHAQEYPTRMIDIIVPLVPGGATDVLARLIGHHAEKKWGVRVNVINKPGGNTIPANLEVYLAKPDGYTMFSDSQSSCSLLEVAIRDLPFKVLDRTFIALMTASPHLFIVNTASPFKSLKDIESDAKRDPGHFTWGSGGGVGAGDFIMRQFFKAIGVDVLKTKPVTCRGGAEIVSFVAGGHMKFGSSTILAVLPHAAALRVVGVSGFRTSEFPDVPTAVEQGYPTLTGLFWTGISGPPKLPSHIIAKWDDVIQEMLKDPEILTKMKNLGLKPFYLNSSKAKEHVKKEMEFAAELWGLK